MKIANFFRALAANLLFIGIALAVYAGIVTLCVYAYASHRPSVMVDVVFVFDTTGSMQPKINSLLDTSSDFADILQQAGANYQLSMVSFGSLEETQVIRETFPPSSNLSAFQSFLGKIHATGGGREDQITALDYALKNFTYRQNTMKILILITDESLYGGETTDPAQLPLKEWDAVVQRVTDEKITAYAVCPDREYFRNLAQRTSGDFYDIERNRDFTGILMKIAQNINASLTR